MDLSVSFRETCRQVQAGMAEPYSAWTSERNGVKFGDDTDMVITLKG
jgi:hypothetical protein